MDAAFSDCIRTLREIDKVEDLWSHMVAFFTARGVRKFSYHRYRGVAGGAQEPMPAEGVEVIAQGFDEDWVCRYIQQKLYQVDPIPELARGVTAPFFWSDAEKLARLTDSQKTFMGEMLKAGVGEGLAMHVFGPEMRNAYVGLGFGALRPELNASEVTELQCVAQMGHLRRCELIEYGRARRMDLSPREREILHWIARGKSNGAIATILEISPHTIDTLTRRLFDKLDVSDRTSAAIRGVGSGLVLPG